MKTTKLFLFIMLFASIVTSTFAQIPYTKGRIAMSSDGNYADEDDWAATPVALMMLAKAGLQDNFVVYTYADHVWSSMNTSEGDNMLEELRKSVNGAKDYWGFDNTNFIEAVTNPEQAYNAMRDEINASTADDPLTIICAGPMQVVGTALSRANTSALQYVTVVSHSTWNDNHAVEPFSWESHASTPTTWSWTGMETAFPDANFVHINDQNQAGNADLGFNTNWVGGVQGAPIVWTYWDWMESSSDPSLNWVYERMQKVGRADASDAGMTWYVIHGSEGNPTKLIDYIGGCVNCDVTGIQYGADYVVFEAETAELTSEWTLRKKGDASYEEYVYFPTPDIDPINDTYIQHTGGSTTSLKYTFTCPKTGVYQLAMRMHSALQETTHDYKTITVNGESLNVEKDDKRNDVWVRMEGNFTSAMGTYSTEDLKTDEKFYGSGPNKWGNCYKLEHNGHFPPKYNFTEGEEYTLVIKGRSAGTCIDYIVLFDVAGAGNITLNDQDLAIQLPENYRPKSVATPGVSCAEVKAVDFEKFTGITGFTDAATGIKDGTDFLQIVERDAKAAAQFTYQGDDADVTFTINTLLEVDGEPTYTLKVNGTLVGAVTNPITHGTSTPDYTLHAHTVNETPYALKKGDVIQIEFDNVTNGMVPEGGLTATARGRWHSMEICAEGGVKIPEPEIPNIDPNPNPTGASISTEAEDYTVTSGTTDDATWGGPGFGVGKTATNINWVNAGDYVEYEIDVPTDGNYYMTYYISTPNTGTTIEFLDEGESKDVTTVVNNSNWDTFYPLYVQEAIYLTEGSHTITLKAGNGTWAWNLDKFTIQQETLTSNISTIADQNIQVYPSPTTDFINITNVEAEVKVIDVSGVVLKSQFVSGQDVIDISMLNNGLYFIYIKQTEGNVVVTRVIKE